MSRLVRKIADFSPLSDDERLATTNLCDAVVIKNSGEDLIREGERPRHIHLMIEGWAVRYKLLSNGGRQISGYLIPGDLGDINAFVVPKMDHSIGLLSDAKVGLIGERAVANLLGAHPRLARALAWSTLVDTATAREWLANTLRRPPSNG